MPRNLILIVDDSRDVREVIAALLESLDYRCVTADCGEKALEIALRERPDLVLVDVRMPGLDGFETVRRIREKISMRVPIVMLTGLDDVETRVCAIQSGANDILTKPVDRFLLDVRIQTLIEQEKLFDQVSATQHLALALLKAMEAKSRYSSGHARRTGLWAQRISIEFGFSAERALLMRSAGALHDIGKIGVPDAILEKPGPLTPEESEIMKTHTILGELILKSGETDPIIIEIARSHHERMDGGGYPDGKKAADLPVEVKIVQVADVFDAMTSRRPYQQATPPLKAVNLIKESAAQGQVDPQIVNILIELVRTKQIHPVNH